MSSIPLAPAVLFSSVTTALDNLGLSSERIVEQAGLPQWQFLEPRSKIPGPHLYRLLGHTARALGEEGFGLMVPDHVPLRSVGSFGKMIFRSLTVYDAINMLNRLYKRISSVARFSIVEDDEEVWWVRDRLFDADVGSRQMELYSFGHMINLVRLGAGSAWRPAKVCVELDSISRLDQLEAFGDAEIQRRRGVSSFAIPRSVLSRSMPSQTSAVLDKGDRFLADAPSTEFVDSLRQLLRSFVKLSHPRIETVAEIGGVSARTLQRRLRAEGLTFKTVVDQARFQVAADLMGEKDLTLVDIAQELSYADQAHFTHAFRRWAGVSPGQYRSQLRSD